MTTENRAVSRATEHRSRYAIIGEDMKLTNIYNLPEAFYRAVQNDKYSRGNADYSATDLISPPRIVHLKRRHDDEIVEDVSDRIWSLFGSAVHHVLERSRPINALTEERIYTDMAGRVISGAADIYDGNGVISDYKTTSVFTAIYGSRIEEWTAQLNIYAYLFRSHGFDVNRIVVVIMYRDWRSAEALRMSDYPKGSVEEIELDLWTIEEQREYIHSRLRLMIESESLTDEELPECTDKEMWTKGEAWAVMKGKNIKASRVLQSESEAAAWISAQDRPEQYSVVYRAPERKRCESYCSVSEFCSQFKAYKESNQ